MAAVLELIATTIVPENFTLANNSTNSTHVREWLSFVLSLIMDIPQTTFGPGHPIFCVCYILDAIVVLLYVKTSLRP